MEKDRPKKLLILYATQTGNAVEAAEWMGREAERQRLLPGPPPFHGQIRRWLLSSRGGQRNSLVNAIFSSHSHRTWNWVCTFSWICGRKSHTKFEWFKNCSNDVLLWLQKQRQRFFLYKDFRLSHSENGGILSGSKGWRVLCCLLKGRPAT
ncbi:hypothetical protein ACFX15_009121 [Malus domestica]